MYQGTNYILPQDGGLYCNDNYDKVPLNAIIDCSNVNHFNGGRQPRGGCTASNGTAIPSTPSIMGLYQFTLENGNTFLVCGNSDGTIYTSDQGDFTTIDTLLKSGLESSKYFHFETFYNKLYICNGYNIPQVWDGVKTYTWDFGSPSTPPTAALAGLGAGNVNSGTHSYKVTFVSASGESTGSVKSGVVTTTAGNGQVALSAIPLGITGTTARKIYRTVAGDTGAWKLLATIADNTTTTYADNIADASLTTDAPTTSTAFAPTDWTAGNCPKAMIVHGVRAQKRLWAYGSANRPDYLYASDSGTDDMSDANVITIKILQKAITALIEFGGRLIAFNRDKTFIVDDTPMDVAEWGYQSAIWEGGAANQRVVVKTPTDVIVMSETGEIFSITASEQYGDYQIASIVRPAFLHRWIEANIDLTQIAGFHGVYDQEMRCIKLFMIYKGFSSPAVALVLFVDLGAQLGWTKHDFQMSHMCSTQVRVSASDWRVYTGGTTGKAYYLESSTLTDDGTVYRVSFLLPPLSMQNPRSTKRFDKFWITTMARAFETLKLNVYVDDRTLTGGYTVIDESGNTIIDENSYEMLSEPSDPYEIVMEGASSILKNYGDDIGSIGQRLQIECYNDTGQNFFLSQIMVDFLDLGNQYDNYY